MAMTWNELVAQAQKAQQAYQADVMSRRGEYNEFDPNSLIDWNGSKAMLHLPNAPTNSWNGEADPNYNRWDNAHLSYSDPTDNDYGFRLMRGEDGSVVKQRYRDVADIGFAMDMMKFAGTATGLHGLTSALSAGLPEVGKFALKKGAGKLVGEAVGAAVKSAVGGPSQPGVRTATGAPSLFNGTNAMTLDPSLQNLLSLGLDYAGASKIAQNIQGTANTSAANLNNIAATTAQQGKFTPYNIQSGFGTTWTDANGKLTQTLDPAHAQVKSAAHEQMMGLLTPYTNQNVSDISGQAYGLSKEWLAKRANPLYEQNATLGLQGANNLIGKAGAFDPEANAKIEYDLTQKLLAPTREQDNLNMENRLMNQGRLGLSYGSTGAAPELAALAQAQRMQDLTLSKDSRQLAFDRQKDILNQANVLQGMGISADKAGLDMQQGYYSMANGLFGMGMSGDKFIEDMNNSRTSRAGALQQIGNYGDEQMLRQQQLAIQAGQAQSQAANAGANRQAELQKLAEQIRYGGAVSGNAIQNQALSNAIGSSKGLLSGGSGGGLLSAGAGMIQKLLQSGMNPDDLGKLISDSGLDISQMIPEYGDVVDNFDFDGLEDWANSFDF